MGNTKLKGISAVLGVALIIGTCTASQANFADDWVSQTSKTDAGYFKGSQRGYFNGGSFSARWPQSNDNLLTISPPRLKSGCGGIDMFLGGFSFLDTDYLVQKLQRILSAAPAAAFDIALKTLAPQVSDTIKSLESIVDKLNNLQLDDCKAAKALVTMTPNPFSGKAGEAYDAEAAAAKTDFMTSSGLGNDWKGSIDKLKTSMKNLVSGGKATDVQQVSNASIAGCPAVLKTVFTGGSVLEKIGNMKGIPSSYVDSMRGFIGDVYVVTPADTGADYDAVYLPPCGKNTYQSMIDGTAQIADNEGVCKANSDTNSNLTLYVAKNLTIISNKIKSRTALSDPEYQFLASIPLPIMPALRGAIQTGTETTVISKLADVSAKGLAYQMMMDMILRIYQINDYANHIRSNQKTAGDNCQIAMFEKPLQYMDQVIGRAGERTREAYEGYSAAVASASSIEDLINSLQKFNDITRREITARFNRGLAGRATGIN